MIRVKFLAMTLFAALFAGGAAHGLEPGDVERGTTVFKKCGSCHKVGPEAKNGVGPVLNGIVGRMAGTFPDYNYSKANKSSGVTWEIENLTVYLRAPRAFIPGTKMPFPGLKDDQDIADLLAFLVRFDADGNLIE